MISWICWVGEFLRIRHITIKPPFGRIFLSRHLKQIQVSIWYKIALKWICFTSVADVLIETRANPHVSLFLRGSGKYEFEWLLSTRPLLPQKCWHSPNFLCQKGDETKTKSEKLNDACKKRGLTFGVMFRGKTQGFVTVPETNIAPMCKGRSRQATSIGRTNDEVFFDNDEFGDHMYNGNPNILYICLPFFL